MAEIPIALIVVLLLNAAATEQIEKSDKKYSEADSKIVEAKIRVSHHPTSIKQKTSTTSKDDVSSSKESELAQESVEQGRRRPVQENNYDFGYAVNDAFDGHQFRQEQMTDDGTVHGRFGYRDTKGMFRQVDYMADDFGFRANIKTNEPGTMDLDPANVDIDRMHFVDLKREHRPHYSRKPHQALKTSAVKKVGHEYDSDDSRDYQESYEHNSEEDDDEEDENAHSSYHGAEGSSEDQEYQIPKKKGKAIIYQYFHKQHTTHHEENPHSFADNEHVEETPHHHQQQPNHYDAPEKTSYEDSNETPQHLTLSRLPEPNHHELHAEHVSPKYEVYDEEHKEFVKTPKYSKLLKEQPIYSHHGQHNIHEHDPKPRFPVENSYPVYDRDDRRRKKPIRHEHPRRNPNDRIYSDEMKAPPYHGKTNSNQQNHHTYSHPKHLRESTHARHPTDYHSTNNYAGNEHYGNINPRYRGQTHDPSHEAEVHHHGLVRDSTYRRPSRPVPQETTIEVREKQSHDETHKNRIRSKYVSSLKHNVEPKFPVKILYTPSHNSQIDSTLSYQGPVHKKYFREEIVYGFPVGKHIAKHDGHQADFPSYETINETSSEEVQSLDYTRYPSSHSKPEAMSHQKQKTYIIVHKKQVESQPNHEHRIDGDKDMILKNSQKESIPQLQNANIGPKFAVLFDPSVFKHFEKFRISGRNADESKWIPIIPQIKWLPQSTPPSTDWIPMPSSRVKRYH